jgi:hypothetical protein
VGFARRGRREEALRKAFRRGLGRRRSTRFKPQAIYISAGFRRAHRADDMAGLRWVEEDYRVGHSAIARARRRSTSEPALARDASVSCLESAAYHLFQSSRGSVAGPTSGDWRAPDRERTRRARPATNAHTVTGPARQVAASSRP